MPLIATGSLPAGLGTPIIPNVLPIHQVDIFKNRVRGGRSTLLIDHRASDMRTGVYNGLEEMHTFTCVHCDRVIRLNAQGKVTHGTIYKEAETGHVLAIVSKSWGEPGWCAKCNARRCDNAICIKFCTPIAKRLELQLPAEPDEIEQKADLIEQKLY